MKLLARLQNGVLPDHIRDWHLTRERMQADFTEFVFRIAEMTLVCGAVVYIERRLGAAPIASTILSAVVAIFARSRATAGMLDLMASHEFGPRKQQLIYWLIQAVALLLFAGIVALTNAVVPLIANVQSVASAQ